MVVHDDLVVPLRYRHLVGANGFVVGSDDRTSHDIELLLFNCPFTDLFFQYPPHAPVQGWHLWTHVSQEEAL